MSDLNKKLLKMADMQGMLNQAKDTLSSGYDATKNYLEQNPTLAYGAGGALLGGGIGAIIQALRGKSMLKGLLGGGLVGAGLGAGGKMMFDNQDKLKSMLGMGQAPEAPAATSSPTAGVSRGPTQLSFTKQKDPDDLLNLKTEDYVAELKKNLGIPGYYFTD